LTTKTKTIFPPLESVLNPTVSTYAAASYLGLAPQTMFIYACKETGPIRPIRIGRRLHWPVRDLKRLLGVM
jgi:hypothetical protein